MDNEIKEKQEKETDIKKLFEECELKQDEYLKGWQRERADYLNYKKDEVKRAEEERLKIKINFIRSFLPIYDSLEKAKESTGNDQILNQFENFLKNQGVNKIKSVGEKFNPEFHESLEAIESEKEAGTIIEEAQSGWMINEYVIRAARVKITK